MSSSFATPQEGFEYLESFTNLEKTQNYTKRTYRLDRMEALTELFGRPQDSFRVLHLAGSKGKGSTAIYLARALTSRGYKTGLYTSPHITGYKERITLAGREMEDAVFLREMERIKTCVENLGPDTLPGGAEPTTFELLTLLAFLVFKAAGCSWVVLETGMGGRLDATNVARPEGVFLTPIELEHTEYLGDTIAAIAGEKGGIIKQGIPVFCAPQKPEALEVLKRIAAEKEAPFHELAKRSAERSSKTTPGGEDVTVRWNDGTESRWLLKMTGSHQRDNAALAALGLKDLFASRGGFPEDKLAESFAEAALPGRMERIEKDGTVWIFDGAHTPVSAALTAGTFEKLLGRGGILIFGTAKGKPAEPIFRELKALFDHAIISRAGDFKPEDPQVLYKNLKREFPQDGPELELIPEPAEAFDRARKLSGGMKPVLVTGSFYMVAAVRNCLTAG